MPPSDVENKYNQQIQILRNIQGCIIAATTLAVYFAIVTLSIPVYIFRWTLVCSSKRFRPDLGPCMSFLSSYLTTDLYTGKPPRCSTILPITLNGKLTKEDLLQVVSKNWIEAVEENGDLKYPQFRNHCSPWLGISFWKTDVQFDVKNHVFSYSEKERLAPGTIVTEADLDVFVEKMLNQMYPSERSPWDIHVVENYQNNKFGTDPNANLSLMVLRIHHSMGDGYSLLDALVSGLFEIDLNVLKLPKISYPKLSLWKKIAFIATLPIVLVKESVTMFTTMWMDCPWKAPDSVKRWYHRYAKSELISIEKVKHIKSTLGVSFTSVLLSAISSGIYRNLESKRRRNVLRVEKQGDYMSCMSAIPLPETEATRKIRLKNNVSGLLIRIPSCHFTTPLDRLKRCDEILDACKNSIVPAASTWYLKSIGYHLRSLIYAIGKNRIISTGLTNFPTKPKTDYFGNLAGREILFAEFASGTLVGDAGVGFMVVSFYPYIRVTVTADSAVLSREEIDHLVKYIEEELNVLYAIANAIKQNQSN